MPAIVKNNLLNLVSVVAALMIVAICSSLFAKLIATHENPQSQAQARQGIDKYNYGTCTVDSDCVPTGCSSEMCSSDPTLATTCEIKADMPDPGIYFCGCVQGQCAWYAYGE